MARLVVIAAVVAALLPASASAGVAFAPAQTQGVGSRPVQIVRAGLNADALPDLVTVNDNSSAGSHITVLLNTGTGFAAKSLTNTDNATSIAAGDVTGDAIADLVVANHSSPDGADGLSILVNKGDGTFAAPVFHDVSDGDSPWGVALVYRFGLVGAVAADVVVTGVQHGGSDGRLTVFQNDGAGNLVEQPAIPIPADARGITPFDLNTDFLTDLFIAHGGAAGGVGDVVDVAGQYSPVDFAGTTGADDARWVGAGDLTGDRVPDAVVPSPAGDQVYVVPVATDGTLGDPEPHAAGDMPAAAVVEDFDRDGHNDIAVASAGSTNGVSLLLGGSGGGFTAAGSLPAGVADASPQSVVAGDLNHDGYADIALADTNADTVSVFYAIPPKVEISPNELSFGDVPMEGVAERTTTVSNLGPQVLLLPDPIDLSGRDQADFQIRGTTCGASLAPGTSCTVDVAFTPSLKGERLAWLYVSTTGRGASGAVALTGRGVVAPPVFAPSPGSRAVLGVRQAATRRCVVPKLKGKTLKSARKLLRKGRCRLGKVKKARISKKAKARNRARIKSKRYKATTVIYKQSPTAKKRVKLNSKVSVTVRTKLEKVRRSARKR